MAKLAITMSHQRVKSQYKKNCFKVLWVVARVLLMTRVFCKAGLGPKSSPWLLRGLSVSSVCSEVFWLLRDCVPFAITFWPVCVCFSHYEEVSLFAHSHSRPLPIIPLGKCPVCPITNPGSRCARWAFLFFRCIASDNHKNDQGCLWGSTGVLHCF